MLTHGSKVGSPGRPRELCPGFYYLIFILFYMYEYFHCMYIYVPRMCTYCPKRPEEVVKFPGTRVMEVVVCWGGNLGPLATNALKY